MNAVRYNPGGVVRSEIETDIRGLYLRRGCFRNASSFLASPFYGVPEQRCQRFVKQPASHCCDYKNPVSREAWAVASKKKRLNPD